ncbi:MAG: dephospho-CoA kinase [Acidobacteriota bacterium]|jgi:dephospho-CoA kinase
MTLRVALTGGIATGKSFCLARFAALGVPVVDADALARDVVSAGSAALASIRARFGDSIIAPGGTLDRAALGRIVFRDRAARTDLEAIVHPAVYRRITEWFITLPPETRLAIADIPLLFETGHSPDFHRVVVCACDPAEQLRRLMRRDGLSEADARARLAAQWPIIEKVARADYVIRTDGTMADTEAGVRTVLEKLKAE